MTVSVWIEYFTLGCRVTVAECYCSDVPPEQFEGMSHKNLSRAQTWLNIPVQIFHLKLAAPQNLLKECLWQSLWILKGSLVQRCVVHCEINHLCFIGRMMGTGMCGIRCSPFLSTKIDHLSLRWFWRIRWGPLLCEAGFHGVKIFALSSIVITVLEVLGSFRWVCDLLHQLHVSRRY